ncbi:Crp/Fnr family transcriptional regulator [Paucibacter sp. M5-1]|uniref:Crp/Fnr family transcriptional regulator n=1 Tax=Paucibacter sp. M5-1 TaxID=3015998 RepID=UPI0022B86010|nr:Crp/Fnr family transcriptional regulator [Paucibacter sp. M5-1]MCZ7881098.1 Crp/Fnr family transcriptional regulator [Paucibacter sp. M5-1]
MGHALSRPLPESSQTSAPEAPVNRLLEALSETEQQGLRPDLEPVLLRYGQVIQEPGLDLKYLYFPVSAVVSLLCPTENGAATQIAVVGNEGVVGVALFMGGGSMPGRAFVQCAGQAWRIKAVPLLAEFHRGGALTQLLLRSTQALITQMAQTAVCNRRHGLEQQLCRWLLLSLDRLSGNEMVITHETIAGLLGVRREGVSEATGHLRELGLIEGSRGHITVLDRLGLEARACECYRVLRRECERLLPPL